MQPHRYSRLDDLFEDFCKCFNAADTVIVTDVYEAGETPIEGRDKHGLVEGIKSHGHRDVKALPERGELAHMISKTAKPGDYVICMGAGDITAYANALPAQLDEELAKSKGAVA
jgi:UDP-N-acetylmuramate--alanine ligase